ncbi:hypothetical protein SMICM304S_05408 [Streptomyces microflavus]
MGWYEFWMGTVTLWIQASPEHSSCPVNSSTTLEKVNPASAARLARTPFSTSDASLIAVRSASVSPAMQLPDSW